MLAWKSRIPCQVSGNPESRVKQSKSALLTLEGEVLLGIQSGCMSLSSGKKRLKGVTRVDVRSLEVSFKITDGISSSGYNVDRRTGKTKFLKSNQKICLPRHTL